MKPRWIRGGSLAAIGALLFACDPASGPEAALPPLQKWSFSGKQITYKSGIAIRSRDADKKLIPGLTVWLTDQSIDCSTTGNLPNFVGGWVGITYPETGLGKRSVTVNVGYWSNGAGLDGNIIAPGKAALAKADTAAEKTVAGSLDFHSEELDPENGFGKADVTGGFSVPYCPEI